MAILQELERQPIAKNGYRTESGKGRSQAFGIVHRRSVPPDYSRWCWIRPYLYKLLLEFAKKHVTIPFTSITVNDNYAAAKHKDRGNTGDSFLVAFGDYTGGELEIFEGPLKGLHDVRYKPIVTDFANTWHAVKPFTGKRYSLVFYTLQPRGTWRIDTLPPPSVGMQGNKYVFMRGDEMILKGLDHPLKKKPDANLEIEEKETVLSFA